MKEIILTVIPATQDNELSHTPSYFFVAIILIYFQHRHSSFVS